MTASITRDEALKRIQDWLSAGSPMQDPLDDVVFWAENRFYVPDQIDPDQMVPSENTGPIILMPHQKTLLRYMFDPNRPSNETFQSMVFSTVKKSGKSAVAAMIGRWIAERWGPYSDVVLVGNDAEQARSRIYDAAVHSLELDPGFDKQRRELMAPDGTTEWRIIRSTATHIPNEGRMRPIALDPKGEAGANPTASIFTELAGADQERARRLYDELCPPPTRPRAIRFCEGYAGYESESLLWWDIWQTARQEGRRISRDELTVYGEWPFEDDPPVWINPAARMVAYIDQGVEARRMPWQLGERGLQYYRSQEATERPEAFARLHLNLWSSGISAFIPPAWWSACEDRTLPQPGKNTPIVIGVDASVTGDCTAIVGVCRHPTKPNDVQVLFCRVWTPTPGHPLDYGAPDGLEQELKRMCAQYTVAEVAFDPYQLMKLANDFARDGIAWMRPFNQTQERSKADKQLWDLIRDRRIHHPGFQDLTDHALNAAAKHAPDENTRLRIIKKTTSSKIDALIATSMAAAECLRLNLT